MFLFSFGSVLVMFGVRIKRPTFPQPGEKHVPIVHPHLRDEQRVERVSVEMGAVGGCVSGPEVIAASHDRDVALVGEDTDLVQHGVVIITVITTITVKITVTNTITIAVTVTVKITATATVK